MGNGFSWSKILGQQIPSPLKKAGDQKPADGEVDVNEAENAADESAASKKWKGFSFEVEANDESYSMSKVPKISEGGPESASNQSADQSETTSQEVLSTEETSGEPDVESEPMTEVTSLSEAGLDPIEIETSSGQDSEEKESAESVEFTGISTSSDPESELDPLARIRLMQELARQEDEARGENNLDLIHHDGFAFGTSEPGGVDSHGDLDAEEVDEVEISQVENNQYFASSSVVENEVQAEKDQSEVSDFESKVEGQLESVDESNALVPEEVDGVEPESHEVYAESNEFELEEVESAENQPAGNSCPESEVNFEPEVEPSEPQVLDTDEGLSVATGEGREALNLESDEANEAEHFDSAEEASSTTEPEESFAENEEFQLENVAIEPPPVQDFGVGYEVVTQDIKSEVNESTEFENMGQSEPLAEEFENVTAESMIAPPVIEAVFAESTADPIETKTVQVDSNELESGVAVEEPCDEDQLAGSKADTAIENSEEPPGPLEMEACEPVASDELVDSEIPDEATEQVALEVEDTSEASDVVEVALPEVLDQEECEEFAVEQVSDPEVEALTLDETILNEAPESEDPGTELSAELAEPESSVPEETLASADVETFESKFDDSEEVEVPQDAVAEPVEDVQDDDVTSLVDEIVVSQDDFTGELPEAEAKGSEFEPEPLEVTDQLGEVTDEAISAPQSTIPDVFLKNIEPSQLEPVTELQAPTKLRASGSPDFGGTLAIDPRTGLPMSFDQMNLRPDLLLDDEPANASLENKSQYQPAHVPVDVHSIDVSDHRFDHPTDNEATYTEVDDARNVAECHIDDILRFGIEHKASDIHLTVGLPPMMRLDGEICPMPFTLMTAEDIKRLIYDTLADEQVEKFETTHELDFAYTVRGLSRFRFNVFMQRGSMAGALRAIPTKIPSFDTLGLPPVIRELSKRTSGLVLVTGPTGSGKSTTIASMIDDINDNRTSHIVTLEDPIEYLHQHKKCMVNQRELHSDTYSLANALRAVLREDPDIILVGELRDLETIEAALTLAETGHLVFGTLHTRNAPASVDRVVDVFPSDQQAQIRVLLGNTLEGIVSQQLLPKLGGGRCAALEIMVATPAIKNLIREGKTHQMYSSIETGGQLGMQTMDSSLAAFVKMGYCSYDECLMRAVDKENFARLAKVAA